MNSVMDDRDGKKIRAPLNPEAETDPGKDIPATIGIISKMDLAKARREALQNGAFAFAFRRIPERTAFSGMNKVIDRPDNSLFSQLTSYSDHFEGPWQTEFMPRVD
jgi:hypothetical protein